MLDLAEQSGTPCWSSSALRFAEEYQAADKTNIKGVNAWGPNGFEDYAIHQLEPIFMMMQAPATEVMHLINDEVYTGRSCALRTAAPQRFPATQRARRS